MDFLHIRHHGRSSHFLFGPSQPPETHLVSLGLGISPLYSSDIRSRQGNVVAARLVLSGPKRGQMEKELITRPQRDAPASYVEFTMHLQPFCVFHMASVMIRFCSGQDFISCHVTFDAFITAAI